MTTVRRCPVHDQPVRDATLCRQCVRDLDQALTDVPGVVDDLLTLLTRQTATSDRVGGGSGERPLPFDQAASKLLHQLHRSLAGWITEVRILTPSVGPTCQRCRHSSCDRIRFALPVANNPTAMAGWLRDRLDRLAQYPHALELAADLQEVIDAARDAVDLPYRLYLGPCQTAGCVERDPRGRERPTSLYATDTDAATVVCRGCEMSYDVAELKASLRETASDRLASATEISRALTSLDEPVTPERIWKWAERGRLVARGLDPDKHPTYRIGDVQDLLAEADRVKQAKAERRRQQAEAAAERARRDRKTG